MKNAIRFESLAISALAFGLVLQQPALAQHDHGGGMPTPSPISTVRTAKVTGTLVSRDEASITVEAKQTGAVTYMVDTRTIFKGDIQPGAEVVVKSEVRNGMQMATAVEAKRTKAKPSR